MSDADDQMGGNESAKQEETIPAPKSGGREERNDAGQPTKDDQAAANRQDGPVGPGGIRIPADQRPVPAED